MGTYLCDNKTQQIVEQVLWMQACLLRRLPQGFNKASEEVSHLPQDSQPQKYTSGICALAVTYHVLQAAIDMMPKRVQLLYGSEMLAILATCRLASIDDWVLVWCTTSKQAPAAAATAA